MAVLSLPTFRSMEFAITIPPAHHFAAYRLSCLVISIVPRYLIAASVAFRAHTSSIIHFERRQFNLCNFQQLKRRADFTWKWFSNQKFCSRSDNMRVCMYIHIYIYYYWIAIRYFLPLFFSIVSFWFYYCFLFFFLRWNIVSYSILYYVYRNTWRLIMNVGMKFLKNWIYIYIYFLWKKP